MSKLDAIDERMGFDGRNRSLVMCEWANERMGGGTSELQSQSNEQEALASKDDGWEGPEPGEPLFDAPGGPVRQPNWTPLQRP
ncbi:hypothetical protein RHS03_05226, partial [Rhizoctonia solani]